MICKKFSDMTPVEKVLFIGELTHACMSDDDLHEMGESLIELAKSKGLFDNVKINPPKSIEDDSKD
jgi:hypothetical protein